jgi:hypothetical protein
MTFAEPTPVTAVTHRHRVGVARVRTVSPQIGRSMCESGPVVQSVTRSGGCDAPVVRCLGLPVHSPSSLVRIQDWWSTKRLAGGRRPAAGWRSAVGGRRRAVESQDVV